MTLACIIENTWKHQSVKDALWYKTVPFLLGLCPGENWLAGHYVGSIGPIWFLVVLALAGFILNLVFRLEPEWMRAVCIIVAVAWCTRLPFISLIPFCIITGAVLLRLYVYWLSAENPRSFIRIIRKENYHHTGNSGFFHYDSREY